MKRATKYVNFYKALKKIFLRDAVQRLLYKFYLVMVSCIILNNRIEQYWEQLGDESANNKHHIIVKFIKRHNLQIRKK